jgi:spermidine synthase
MYKFLICSIFFISGMCGLIYEVLWVRTLGLVFGVTVYATSIVLAAYMSGLAAGSFYFGRLIDRKAGNNLFRYACLEFLVAASACCASFIFFGLSRPAAPVFPVIPLSLCVVVLLFVPTFFMGGTLPVICRHLISAVKDVGRFTGALYGLNTLGGMAGCLAAGFILIRIFGVRDSVFIAVFSNGAIAVIALLLSRKDRSVSVKEPVVQAITTEPAAALEIKFAPLLLVFYALSGFCSLGYEVLWTRALMFNLGNDTYAFSLMLGTFLLGLGAGSAILSRYVNRLSNAIAFLGLLQLLIGITVFCGADLLYRMDSIVDWIWKRSGENWSAAIIARFSGAALLMALPTMLIGAAMPVVNRIYSATRKGIGLSIGSVYSANTIGAIIGSLSAAFLLIPFFGITRSILVLAGVTIVTGMACFFFQPRQSYRWAGIVTVLLVIPFAGVFSSRPGHGPFLLHTEGAAALYYREGVTASVAVMKDPAGAKMLNVNGVYTAYTNTGDLQVHYLLGYLPYFLCPEPEKALVIGLGLGVTASSLESTGMHVDCVELAKEEIGSAPYFSEYNDAILGKPRFSLIIGDGRHYLLKTARRYDIITSNAVHVRLSPYLYTREFYEICRNRLNPHGVVCQWLPSNNLPEREFKQLIKAFLCVFPHTSIWYVNPGHLLLIGTSDPFSINYQRFFSRCMRPEVQKKLSSVYLNNPLVIISLCLLDEKGTMVYAGSSAPHSDDKPCAEFVRVVETKKVVVIPQTLRANLTSLVADRNDSLDKKLAALQSASLHSKNGEYAAWFDRYEEALSEYNAALMMYPEDNRTRNLRAEALNFQKIVYLNMGNHALTQNDFSGATDYLKNALAIDSLFAPVYTNFGLLYQMRQLMDSAIISYQKAILLQPQGIEPYVHLGSVYSGTGEFAKALDLFQKALSLDPKCAEAWFGKGYCYHYMGDRQRCAEAFETAFTLGLRDDYKTIAEDLLRQ